MIGSMLEHGTPLARKPFHSGFKKRTLGAPSRSGKKLVQFGSY
jgi:hypothetical protein